MSTKETTSMENNLKEPANIKNNIVSDDKTSESKRTRNFRFADIFVIIFCLSGAAFSLNLFRLDLFQSIASQNIKPMGTVTVKHNNVQRRFSDRVLWNRLSVESPVYLGDLIRVADYSSATLHINNDIIDLNENTLIRIRVSETGEGRIIIDLGSGSLNITSSKAEGVSGSVVSGSAGTSSVAVNVMGRTVAPAAGATLSASAGDDGVTVQVSEGSVVIIEESGQSRPFAAGEKISLDSGGVELAIPSAVVTLPRPNARFLKGNAESLNIRFSWNVINLDQYQLLRLETAADRNFTRLTKITEGINFANAALAAGTWYWRLMYQDRVLDAGQLSIVDATVSTLISPIKDSLFIYKAALPTVKFEWQPVEGASYYILEAGLVDSVNPQITRQTSVASFVEPDMKAGTWNWRVRPVFSSLYEGSTVFTAVSSFRIEQLVETIQAENTNIIDEPVKSINKSVTMVLPEPEPVIIAEVVPEPAIKPAVVRPPEPAPKPVNPQPPALLPEVRNVLPASGKQIHIEDIRANRRIDFSWSPAQGANAYIFTLYQQTGGNRRQIVKTEPLQKTEWTLNDLSVLDNGAFFWQVEAVIIRNGNIERHGRVTESTFVVDIPSLSKNLEIEDIEVIYGH